MGIVIIAAIVEKHRKCTIRKFRKLISLGNSTPILWKLVSADSNNEQFIHELNVALLFPHNIINMEKK